MRIAILSDIHGNTLAQEAVLTDIARSGGVDRSWLLGDYAAIGYDLVGVIYRVTARPNATFICGNTGRFTVEWAVDAADIAAFLRGERMSPWLRLMQAELD